MAGRRKQSIDDPGFTRYVGGDRFQAGGPTPRGFALRAMFEIRPYDEHCLGRHCRICNPPRQRTRKASR